MPTNPAPPLPCDAARRRKVVAEAIALGVPIDYGRTRKLTLVREPGELASIGADIYERMQWLAPRAARAIARMREAARTNGIALDIVSAFTCYGAQLAGKMTDAERREVVRRACPGAPEGR